MACEGDEEEEGGATATTAATATEAASPTAPAGSPTTPALTSGWTKIEPGGDTICARGTPYAFFVHPGTVNRLMVYFQGGGACWSAASCATGSPIFKDAIADIDNPANSAEGVLDLDNPDNPFKDWSFVFVPYCTGDLYWGDNTQTYTEGRGEEIVIHHKGFVNTTAVVDWIQDNLEEPEKILVSGCSAGGYGSVMGASRIHQLYPDVPLYQLGDSAAGISTADFYQNGSPNWHGAQGASGWVPADDTEQTDRTMADLYIGLADLYPDARWSQYNTADDQIQTLFYRGMGGTGDWGELMLASIQEIQGGAANFHSYIAPGKTHCITGSDIFYTREVNGVRFRDWVEAMVSDEAWDDVMCTDCETDPLAQ
jgi:hypothetical protein